MDIFVAQKICNSKILPVLLVVDLMARFFSVTSSFHGPQYFGTRDHSWGMGKHGERDSFSVPRRVLPLEKRKSESFGF